MNIEAVIIGYLQTALETENVYAEMPEKTPAYFFVVDKTGSSTEDELCTSTVAIQSYAASKAEAAELNEDLKEAMNDITELDGISACYLNTDYNLTNKAKKQHRYQAVFDITHY